MRNPPNRQRQQSRDRASTSALELDSFGLARLGRDSSRRDLAAVVARERQVRVMNFAKWGLLFLFCWFVNAQPIRTIDGDTFIADVLPWHGITIRETTRVLGVDTPELKAKDPALRNKAKEAKQFTESWLSKGDVIIETCERDSFGRILARVRRGNEDLTEQLIKNGHGAPYRK